MIFKLLSLFLFFVEVIVFIWEAHQYKQMLELKLVKEPTEKERRTKFAKRNSIFSVAFMGLWIAILILGLALAEERVCQDEQVLENAVCVACRDDKCFSCDKSGSKNCD